MNGWTVVYGTAAGDWVTVAFFALLGTFLGFVVCSVQYLRRPGRHRR